MFEATLGHICLLCLWPQTSSVTWHFESSFISVPEWLSWFAVACGSGHQRRKSHLSLGQQPMWQFHMVEPTRGFRGCPTPTRSAHSLVNISSFISSWENKLLPNVLWEWSAQWCSLALRTSLSRCCVQSFLLIRSYPTVRVWTSPVFSTVFCQHLWWPDVFHW